MRTSFWRDLLSRGAGFHIEEQMRGSHRFLRDFPPSGVSAGTELPLEFQARWGAARVAGYLNPLSKEFFRADLEGRITAGGLCVEAPLQGTLELRYLTDATIRYHLEFSAHAHRFVYDGEKRGIRPWNLHRSHTTCYGTIRELESGEVLSESVVTFDLRDLPRFLASLRLG
jgi:hypothetical protein